MVTREVDRPEVNLSEERRDEVDVEIERTSRRGNERFDDAIDHALLPIHARPLSLARSFSPQEGERERERD